MATVHGMKGMAGPEHDQLSQVEHGHEHRNINGIPTFSSFNSKSRSGSERNKRKISNKDYSATTGRISGFGERGGETNSALSELKTGITTTSRSSHPTYSFGLSHKEHGSSSSLHPSNTNNNNNNNTNNDDNNNRTDDYRSFLQKPPLNSHNSNQEKYSYNFNFNRQNSNPAIYSNGAKNNDGDDDDQEAVEFDSKRVHDRDHYLRHYQNDFNPKFDNDNDLNSNTGSHHGRRSKLSNDFSTSRLYRKNDRSRRSQEGLNHNFHANNATTRQYSTRDRYTTEEKLTNGHQGQDSKRVGSAFSARWSSIDGGETANRDTESQNGRNLSSANSKRPGEFLTIRDILDSKELRDQMSELRRSQNSTTNSVQQHRPLQQEYEYEQHQKNGGLSRRESLRSVVASEFSMDESLLERRFREKLDAFMQTSDHPNPAVSRQSLTTSQQPQMGRTSTSIGNRIGGFRSTSTDHQLKEQLDSTYSPTEPSSPSSSSSSSEDKDEHKSDEDGEQDQDTAELQRTVRPVNATRPKSPITTMLPPTQPLTANSHLEGNTGDVQSIPSGQSRKFSDDLGLRGYIFKNISFEREVELARARRRLGIPTESLNDGTGGPSAANSRVPPKTPASRLDHGRDLALEDLASPVKNDFGTIQKQQQQKLTSNHPQQNQQRFEKTTEGRNNWRPSQNPRMVSVEDEANQPGVHDEWFFTMAGSLGEGQAVGSVLGTLKAKIRQLKSEKKTVMKSNKSLEKGMKKTQRELERLRKKNEKLSLAKAKLASQNADIITRSGSTRMVVSSPNPEVREQESREAGFQREMEKCEQNAEDIQRQIDDLENQRAAVEKKAKDMYTAELFDILNSEIDDSDDDEDDNDVDDDDDEDDESDSESDYEGQVQATEVPEATNRLDLLHVPHIKTASKKKRIKSKKQLNKSKAKEAKVDEADIQSSSKRERSKSRTRNAHSKSPIRDIYSPGEKVEEVHIHHHVHYGDRSSDSRQSPNRLGSTNDDRRITHYDMDDFDITDDFRQLKIGNGFRPRKSALKDRLDIPPTSFRNTFSKSLPGQKSFLERYSESFMDEHRPQAPLPRRHHASSQIIRGFDVAQQPNKSFDDADEERFRPFRVRSNGALSGARAKSTSRVDGRSGESRVKQLTAALTNQAHKQKKIPLDLQRILSLLKTHDPKLCTVCCNGGDHDHDIVHNNEPRQRNLYPQPSLRVNNKPIDIPSGADNISKKRSTKHTAFKEESDSETSLSTIPSDDQEDDSNILESKQDEQSSYKRRSPVIEVQSSQKKAGALESNSNKGPGRSPEQKLYIILGQLEEEVLQLRKSYVGLSKDLEALERSTDPSFAEDNELGDTTEHSARDPFTNDISNTEAKADRRSDISIERQLRRKKLIKEQLQEVADSLAEKADVILRLQEQYVQKRQKQQQQQQKQKDRHDKERDLRDRKERSNEPSASRREKSSTRRHDDDTPLREEFDEEQYGKNRRSSTSSTKDRRSSKDLSFKNADTEELDTHSNEEQQSETEYNNDTLDTARPLKHQTKHRFSPRDEEIESSEDENIPRVESSRRHQDSKIGRPVTGNRGIKESEGFRPRFDGFRVPKLHQ